MDTAIKPIHTLTQVIEEGPAESSLLGSASTVDSVTNVGSTSHSLSERLVAHLNQLASLGLNLTDAHSCFIFLPTRRGSLKLVGAHSLCREIVRDFELPNGSGLIGWIARHRRAIHVSPFENDSRTLGVYRSDQQLKSFIGAPIIVPCLPDDEGSSPEQASALGCGVIACDSRKSFAFSKLQGRLLEGLALQAAQTVGLLLESAGQRERFPSGKQGLSQFVQGVQKLGHSLGLSAVEVLRLRCKNFSGLELGYGTQKSIEVFEQVEKLVAQCLPEHSPRMRLPSGELLVAIDSMTGAFYESRIRAVCAHVAQTGQRVDFDFNRQSYRSLRHSNASIDELVAATCFKDSAESQPTSSTRSSVSSKTSTSSVELRGLSRVAPLAEPALSQSEQEVRHYELRRA